jgi:hypothetical protein
MNDPADRTLVAAAARLPDDLLSVAAAAKKHGVGRKVLRRAIDDGLVRCVERRPTEAGIRIMLSEAQLLEDVRSLPSCSELRRAAAD